MASLVDLGPEELQLAVVANVGIQLQIGADQMHKFGLRVTSSAPSILLEVLAQGHAKHVQLFGYGATDSIWVTGGAPFTFFASCRVSDIIDNLLVVDLASSTAYDVLAGQEPDVVVGEEDIVNAQHLAELRIRADLLAALLIVAGRALADADRVETLLERLS